MSSLMKEVWPVIFNSFNFLQETLQQEAVYSVKTKWSSATAISQGRLWGPYQGL